MSQESHTFTLLGYALALALHGGMGAWLYLSPPPEPKGRMVVEVEIRKPPPPAPVLTPPPPPAPERKIAPRERPAEAPRRAAPEKEPPKEVVPVFGLSDKDTVAESGIAVPLGNTTLADPEQRKQAPVEALPPSTGAPGRGYNPVAESELSALPKIDYEACESVLSVKYKASPAHAQGIEGEVVLRIELDEQGKARNVKIVKGLERGLDEMARGFFLFHPRCRFKPAIGKDGKPAAFVIEEYSLNFEITR